MNQERESWHNLKGLFTESPNICPECNQGIILPAMSGDADNDEIYYFGKCNWCGETTD